MINITSGKITVTKLVMRTLRPHKTLRTLRPMLRTNFTAIVLAEII